MEHASGGTRGQDPTGAPSFFFGTPDPVGSVGGGRATGFTLVELVVVLVLLALAATLAAPALRPRSDGALRGLAGLIPGARSAAARRGETMHLRIAASGDWHLEGGASPAGGPVLTGHVEPFRGLPLTLIVSPIGTCGFDARSAAAATAIRLDPLSCELSRAPGRAESSPGAESP